MLHPYRPVTNTVLFDEGYKSTPFKQRLVKDKIRMECQKEGLPTSVINMSFYSKVPGTPSVTQSDQLGTFLKGPNKKLKIFSKLKIRQLE